MWIVAKIKTKEINVFKENLIEKLGKEIIFYCPKVTYNKSIKNKIKKLDKYILDNYIFCYHKKFNKLNALNEIQFSKGLQYFLDGYIQNQKEIEKFIQCCKSNEDEKGYLMPSFFKNLVKNKAQFISGPFANMMFEIIEMQKNKLKILVGNIVTTVSDKAEYLYRPIRL